MLVANYSSFCYVQLLVVAGFIVYRRSFRSCFFALYTSLSLSLCANANAQHIHFGPTGSLRFLIYVSNFRRLYATFHSFNW